MYSKTFRKTPEAPILVQMEQKSLISGLAVSERNSPQSGAFVNSSVYTTAADVHYEHGNVKKSICSCLENAFALDFQN